LAAAKDFQASNRMISWLTPNHHCTVGYENAASNLPRGYRNDNFGLGRPSHAVFSMEEGASDVGVSVGLVLGLCRWRGCSEKLHFGG
jgi:hypothetical protein